MLFGRDFGNDETNARVGRIYNRVFHLIDAVLIEGSQLAEIIHDGIAYEHARIDVDAARRDFRENHAEIVTALDQKSIVASL